MGVRFTPTGQVRVVGIRVYGGQVMSGTGYITGADHQTVLSSFPVTLLPGWTWTTIAITNGPTVSGDFFVIVSGFTVLCDASNDYSRSYVGTTMPSMNVWTAGDIMIRALVDPVIGGVGGVVLPTNSLTVLAPYLALVGLVATLPIAYAVKKRRN